jgi:hypothetical protein
MANIATITGVKEVLANIKQKDLHLAVRLQLGLKAAGLLLQRESQKLVPVDTGNLKVSAFTRSFGAGWSAKVTVGYTAAYAIYVHEAVGMKLKGQDRPTKGKFWDPQDRAQAKFLEEPARRMAPLLRATIKKYMQI